VAAISLRLVQSAAATARRIYRTFRDRALRCAYHCITAFSRNIQQPAAGRIWRNLETREACARQHRFDLSCFGLPAIEFAASDVGLRPSMGFNRCRRNKDFRPSVAALCSWSLLAAQESLLVGSAEAPSVPDAPISTIYRQPRRSRPDQQRYRC